MVMFMVWMRDRIRVRGMGFGCEGTVAAAGTRPPAAVAVLTADNGSAPGGVGARAASVRCRRSAQGLGAWDWGLGVRATATGQGLGLG